MSTAQKLFILNCMHIILPLSRLTSPDAFQLSLGSFMCERKQHKKFVLLVLYHLYCTTSGYKEQMKLMQFGHILSERLLNRGERMFTIKTGVECLSYFRKPLRNNCIIGTLEILGRTPILGKTKIFEVRGNNPARCMPRPF